MPSIDTVSTKSTDEGRTRWDSHFQFLTSMLSMCIGLGNLWRFPFLVQRWGGGSFVLAFIIMMLVEGAPLLYLEFILGQKYQRGCVETFMKHHPILGGVGLAIAVEAFIIGTYYIAIINWGFYYLFNSLTLSGLPWESCPVNETRQIVEECAQSSPTEYFFYRSTLNVSGEISESSGVVWWMLIVFFLTWAIVYMAVSKGIETSGKVMYVTATFPYFVLAIFLARGLTLPGSIDGLHYMIDVKADKLLDLDLWIDAACQVFYSLCIGSGANIAFTSYSPKTQNMMHDALLVGVFNVGSALYIALVIFSILGFKSTLDYRDCLGYNIEYASDLYDIPYNTFTYENYDDMLVQYPQLENDANMKYCDFTDIIENGVQGTGLAFIVITEAINNMPVPALMSVLFFIMLLMLGLGSMFGALQSVITPIFDFLTSVNIQVSKPLITFIFSLMSCLIGIIFCLDSGYYWVNLFNDYAVNLPFLVLGMLELIVCCWVFGISNWMNINVEMIGHPDTYSFLDKVIFQYFHIMLRYISPIVVLIVFVIMLVGTVTGDYLYETWDAGLAEVVMLKYDTLSIVITILLPVVPLAIIPLYAVIYSCSDGAKQRLDTLITGKPLIKKDEIWGNLREALSFRGLALNK